MFYIGMHSTDNLDDGYSGSGQRLWKSIRKHGKAAHKKEIIEFLPDRKSLSLREEELVTKELLQDPLCMNLRPGGRGIDDLQRITARELLNREWADPQARARRSSAMAEGAVKRYERKDERDDASSRVTKRWQNNPEILKEATQDGLKKWRQNNPDAFRAKQALGTKGKFWITNGKHSRMIMGDVPDGWKKGRA